jgi:endonuclease/exonuclease/phosphatase family metal-dependent hydrolase
MSQGRAVWLAISKLQLSIALLQKHPREPTFYLYYSILLMTRRKPIGQVNARETYDVTPSKPYSPQGIPFRVLTHNIRYATDAPFKGEERWPVRCPLLCSELLFHSNHPATFICLQEVLHSQLCDIMRSLNKTGDQWAYIGVGRDDGERAGEYSPIIYRRDVWKLKRWDPCWLSPTPRIPSKGWDAASTRIATIGQFEISQTGHTVIIATTHFDDQGAESRKRSAELLLEVLGFEAGMIGADATILAGDCNSPPGDEAYKVLTAAGSIMEDVADTVPQGRCYGNEMTFTGFSDASTPSRIDFIFSRKEDKINCGTYAVLANCFDDGVFISDHRACVADFHLFPDS